MTRSSKKQSFLIYRNWLTTWLCLPNDVYIDITKGVFAYFLDEEYTFQTDVGKALFEGYRDILEGNKMHYVEIIKKRSEAGKKSAESRKADVNTCQQVLTDVAEKDKEKDKERKKALLLHHLRSVVRAKTSRSLSIEGKIMDSSQNVKHGLLSFGQSIRKRLAKDRQRKHSLKHVDLK